MKNIIKTRNGLPEIAIGEPNFSENREIGGEFSTKPCSQFHVFVKPMNRLIRVTRKD